MKMRPLLLTVVIALLVVCTIISFGCAPTTPIPPTPGTPSTTAKSEPIKLSFSEMTPPVDVMAKGSQTWIDKVEQLSNGRVDITLFPNNSLVKMADAYDSVLGGIADIARFPPGHTPGVFPLTEGLGLPMIFNSASAKAMTYWELMEKYLRDGEYKKVKVLWVTGVPPAGISSNKKQVKTLEDLQGQKLAAVQANALKSLSLLGAVPTPVNLPEMYTALERGMVDGIAEPAWAAVGLFKMYEVSKYRTAVQLWSAHSVVTMNLDKFNSLPPDIQKIFEQTSGLELVRDLGIQMDAFDKETLENVIFAYDKEKGNPPIYALPEAEQAKWNQIVQPVFEEWIAEMEAQGLPARAFVNDMLEIAQKYN